MRCLIREMDYEQPVAAGRFTYKHDGNPTGALEAWQLNKALEGYYFLRIDQDRRDAASSDSCLAHLLLNPLMNIERLKFRYFGDSNSLKGDVQIDHDIVSLDRTMIDSHGGSTSLDFVERPIQPGVVFWFQSAAGLKLLADGLHNRNNKKSLTLNSEMNFGFRASTAGIECGKEESLTVSRLNVDVRSCSITLNNERIQAWLDVFNWPVRVIFPEGLLAEETSYIRY